MVMEAGGGQKILAILRDLLAPEAAARVNREVARFLQFRRTEQTMDVHLIQVDLLRRSAESKIQEGEDFPGSFVSALRMQNATLSRWGKSLALASA